MKPLLDSNKFTDVQFVVEEGGEKTNFAAHKVIISCASDLFRRVVGVEFSGKSQAFDSSAIEEGSVPGFKKVEREGKNVTVYLAKDIDAQTFQRVLEFLYTGERV